MNRWNIPDWLEREVIERDRRCVYCGVDVRPWCTLNREYFAYFNDVRPHQSLDGNAPRPRAVEPPSRGRIVAEPQVGGLHHRYRRAA